MAHPHSIGENHTEAFLMVQKQRRYSEAVEKGSLATPCNFSIIKNQEVTSDGKSKNDRIWGFSTASAVIFYLGNDALHLRIFIQWLPFRLLIPGRNGVKNAALRFKKNNSHDVLVHHLQAAPTRRPDKANYIPIALDR